MQHPRRAESGAAPLQEHSKQQQQQQQNNNSNHQRRCPQGTSSSRVSRPPGPATSLAVILVSLLQAGPLLAPAFQYDIWFKYPHPHTQTDPVTYCADSQVAASKGQCQSGLPLYVNTLDSPKTLIPYKIDQLLDFCNSTEAREYDHSQHTEWDDNIKLAQQFDLRFLRNEECRTMCTKRYKLSQHTDLFRIEELKLGLTRDYYHHWFTDTFPFSWCYKSQAFNAPAAAAAAAPPAGSLMAAASLNSNTRGKECFIGFPIGYSTDERGLPEDERVPIGNFTKPNAMFLFNHFDFSIFYESGEGKPWAGRAGAQAGRITALRVTPRSINHDFVSDVGAAGASSTSTPSSASGTATNGPNRCSYSMPPMEIPSPYTYGLNVNLSITYSYSVRFIEDEPTGTWAARWQRLELTLPGTYKGKWIFLFSIAMLLATGAPAAYAVARTIFSDRQLVFVNPRDETDEAAWKALAGDIFREPLYIGLFSVLVGSGCQFMASVVLSEFFSAFISFFSTTILVIVVLLFVVVHGFVGGYAGIRLYRTFGGEQWRTICVLVTLLNPLVIFCLLVMSRNLLLLYNGSMMALNVGLFGSLFMSLFCFTISFPSTLAGGNVAFKMVAIEFPVRPTANQREIPAPSAPWRDPLATTLATALVPLFCFWAVESYPFYDSGGYIITVITILTVVALSLAHCYFHLAQHDYRWWWRSYLCCGLAAAYYFLHCIYYIFANLFVDTLANALLYLAFAFFICLALFLLTGTIGFLVTLGFLWQTYSRTNASPDMNYAMFQKGGQIE